jgi:hypothetical protein
MHHLDAKVIHARSGRSVIDNAVALRIDPMYQTIHPNPFGTVGAVPSRTSCNQRYDA